MQSKLEGIVWYETQLSVEGQVHNLIEQAVSPENLSQMFPGWASHL